MFMNETSPLFFGILFCTVLTEKCYILNAVFFLDIAILLFGISCGCFCHFHIAILISNFCHSSAVIFAVSIFRVLYIWPPGGVQFKREGNIAVSGSLFVLLSLLNCSRRLTGD